MSKRSIGSTSSVMAVLEGQVLKMRRAKVLRTPKWCRLIEVLRATTIKYWQRIWPTFGKQSLGYYFLRGGLALTVVLLAIPAHQAWAVQPYDINVILPLTGAGAFVGNTHKRELEILESVVNRKGGINGQPLHFVFFDDQTSPQVAVQLASNLIAKKVPVFLGPSFSAMCKAIAPLLRNGPVDYCLTPAIYPPKGAYTFADSISTRGLLIATMRFLRGKGWDHIGVLVSTDASGQDAYSAIMQALKRPKNRSLSVVDIEHFNTSEMSASAQLVRIKEAKPQALIVWVFGSPFGTVLQGIAQTGLNLPILATPANTVNAELEKYKAAGYLPETLFFPGVSYAAGVATDKRVKEAQKEWADALNKAKMTLNLQSGLAWDPANIVVDALRHLGTEADAQKIHTYIESLHNYAGITGIYDFRGGNQRGLTANDVIMIRWNPVTNSWVASSQFGGRLH